MTVILAHLANRRRLQRQRGSTMTFAAITLFVVIAFCAMVFNTGRVVTTRMEIQNAADAAAYSGALVKANSLSTLTSINDGMAHIYWYMMRYNVDVVVLGTLACIADHPESGDPKAPDYYVGLLQAKIQYETAYRNAQIMIPRGQLTLRTLAKMERAIALATPVMMQKTIYAVARDNGAERVSIFPPLQRLTNLSKYHFVEDDRIERFADQRAKRQVGRNELPDWYVAVKGRTKGDKEYHQTRMCWNRDYHQEIFEMAGLAWGLEQLLHALCPVCHGIGHNCVIPFHVRMHQREAKKRHSPAYDSIDLSKFELPLVLRKDAFADLHVGVWRARHEDPLLFFEDPAWGTFAVASAAAGLVDEAGRQTTGVPKQPGNWLQSDRNNYGFLHWGARLVPSGAMLTPGMPYALRVGFRISGWKADYGSKRDPRINALMAQMNQFAK